MKRRWQRGLHLLTSIPRNMKNALLPLLDKLLLRKRSIMGTLFAKLKPAMGLEHSRHRFPLNTFVCPYPLLSGGLLLGPNQGQYRLVHIPSLSSPYPEPGLILVAEAQLLLTSQANSLPVQSLRSRGRISSVSLGAQPIQPWAIPHS